MAAKPTTTPPCVPETLPPELADVIALQRRLVVEAHQC